MPKLPLIPTSKIDWGKHRIKPFEIAAWGGPEEEGVSQSMLANYLQCKERFRVVHIDGLRPADELCIPIGFGNFWHLCEERFANNEEWVDDLKQYAIEVGLQYPKEQVEISRLYNACKVEFPIYVNYWAEHKEVLARTPLLQEKKFLVPLTLPSGRVVKLRGKWDSIDLIEDREIFLQENKSKTSVQIYKIEKQLLYDLQVMTYLIAIENELEKTGTLPGVPKDKIPSNFILSGVRYNVVLRALSGGLGSIKKCRKTKSKPAESSRAFYQRLATTIEKHQDQYFKRWRVDITKADRDRFSHTTLLPILENLCDDYEWWAWCKLAKVDVYNGVIRREQFKKHCPQNFRLPYGLYSPVLEGGYPRIDDYINTGSTVGLQKSNNFFPELQ